MVLETLKLVYTLLCDDVRIEMGNKISLMGIFQNNAGGAWDNAKKSFEKGVEINGEMFYKKSEPHKASVTGDTVGDPFKDTSGPSMNILIKLMSIVSLIIAPYIYGIGQ